MTDFAMNQLAKKITDIIYKIDDNINDVERHTSWVYIGKNPDGALESITEKQKRESKDWEINYGMAKILDELVELVDEIEECFCSTKIELSGE